MKPPQRHPRRVSNALYVLALVVLVIGASRPDKSASQVVLTFGGVAIAVGAVMYKALHLPRDVSNYVIDISFVVFEAYLLSNVLAQHAHGAANVVLSVVVALFIVVPLPVLVSVYARRQDEFQRSLIVSSGAIAFAASIVGALAYGLLQRVDHLGPVSPLAFAAAAAGAWIVTWFILRVRAS